VVDSDVIILSEAWLENIKEQNICLIFIYLNKQAFVLNYENISGYTLDITVPITKIKMMDWLFLSIII